MSKFENDILRTMGSSKFEEDFIAHHGIKGQKWGVRRYQNSDGTLTNAGKARVAKLEGRRERANSRTASALNRDINSFKPYRNTGIYGRDGRTVYSKKDVRDSMNALEKEKNRQIRATNDHYDRKVARVTGDYSKVHENNMRNAEAAYRKKNGDYKESSVTRRVKNDYRTLSDKDFYGKYATSKKTYAKRVSKYGDPYMNSPSAKAGKSLSAKYNAGVKKIMDKKGVSRSQATKMYNAQQRRKMALGLGVAAASLGAAAYYSHRLDKQTSNFRAKMAQEQAERIKSHNDIVKRASDPALGNPELRKQMNTVGAKMDAIGNSIPKTAPGMVVDKNTGKLVDHASKTSRKTYMLKNDVRGAKTKKLNGDRMRDRRGTLYKQVSKHAKNPAAPVYVPSNKKATLNGKSSSTKTLKRKVHNYDLNTRDGFDKWMMDRRARRMF